MPPKYKTSRMQVEGQSFELRTLQGNEAVSTLFRYEMSAKTALGIGIDDWVGAQATIELEDVFGGQRSIAGILTEAEIRARDTHEGELRLTLEPFPVSLTVGKRSRSFQEMSVVDVARVVLGEAGVPFREELTKVYEPAPYRVQLREDSWSFVARLLESEGIHYYFDTDGSGSLVLCDDSTAAHPSPGSAPLAVLHGTGFLEEYECILNVAASKSAGTTSVSAKSFSWQNPSLGLSVSRGAKRYEAYDSAPHGPSTPRSLEDAAERTKKGIESGAQTVSGRACSLRIAPGHTIEIAGSPDGKVDGIYHITSVGIDSTGSDRVFFTDFKAARVAVPFVPEARTTVPTQAGIAWGTVVARGGDEVFPDAHARVRVQMKWDREGGHNEKSGTWMRVSQRGVPGSMLFPRTGWVVATWNEGGKPDAPYVLSRIHDGEHRPAYALPENKTRVVYKTATVPGGGTFNEIHFEDAAGRENVFWNASKDLQVTVKNQQFERIFNDARHEVTNMQTIDVSGLKSSKVEHNQHYQVGHDETLHVKGSRNEDVAGDEMILIGKSRKINVGGTHTLGVDKSRSLKVGAAMIDTSLGSITSSTMVGLEMVGAAKISLNGQSRTNGADKASLQMTGGVFLEKAATNRNLDVKGDLSETVGVSMTLKAGERFADVTEKSASWTVGGALRVTSKEIAIEAKEKIEIRCGASSIILTKDNITVSTIRLVLEGGELEAVTGTIRHNG